MCLKGAAGVALHGVLSATDLAQDVLPMPAEVAPLGCLCDDAARVEQASMGFLHNSQLMK